MVGGAQLPSPAGQATGACPLNLEMSAKIETQKHKNEINLQACTDHPSCSLICVCDVSITADPPSSIETQVMHSSPVPCSLDPPPSTASQATAVHPLKSYIKMVETQQVKD